MRSGVPGEPRARKLEHALPKAGAAIGLLALFLACLGWWLDFPNLKSRIAASATQALGMPVRIGGRAGVGLFPDLHVTLDRDSLFSPRGTLVASAGQVRIGVRLLSLLGGRLRPSAIRLRLPTVSVVRELDGTLNVDGLARAFRLLSPLDGTRVSCSNGTLSYVDRLTGMTLVASRVDVTVDHVRITIAQADSVLPIVSMDMTLACEELRSNRASATMLRASVQGRAGVFRFEPMSMNVFGGRCSAAALVDLSGPVANYRVHCAIPQFRVEEFLHALSPVRAAVGTMDFTASLSARGENGSRIVQSASGEFSLRSRGLELEGHDIDLALSRFNSSQNFNLVDLGALFFAGPVGLAVTKGYSFGSLFRGTGGHTTILALVSDWTVQDGVARARDVAMATAKSRIALHGELDFVHQRFEDVTFAAIDASGCPSVKQVISGSFAKPVVERPHTFASLAGPAVTLFRRARGIFPTRPCDAFYAGSVAPPR